MIQTLLTLFLITSTGFSAVTGEDDRLSYKELEKRNPAILAKATATQLSRKYLKQQGEVTSYPSGKLQNQCPGEKFSNEPTMGGCSGFLVSENILVTAGHCKDYRAGGCDDDAWLFNHFSPAKPSSHSFKTKDLYYCKKVLDFKHDGEGDFVVIELDRKVKGVTALEMDLKNQGRKGDPVAVLGYPLGRSFTYTPGGRILSKSKNYLRVDSDAFKNNSGSALFNIRTGKVEGILTNARRGMSQNRLDGCQLAKSYKENVVLVNRLKRINYLSDSYAFSSNRSKVDLLNNCSSQVQATFKYRETSENDWLTRNIDLEPGHLHSITDLKGDSIYLFAKTQNETTIKGKDFWGFSDSSRNDEFGFKKIKANKEVLLCP